MELLAVFIKNHFLFKKPEFLNFGGLYLFDFELKENGLYISKSKNTQHIKNFYGENILNVSAIVGNNGSGKTSVMRVLSEDPSKDTVLVYLSKGKIVIKNDARLNLIAQFEYKECKQENKLHPLYFSNHIDYNLRLINSPINQSTLFQETIDDYYYGNILRQLFFLTEKGQFLKENFKELPYYEFLEIKVNNLERAKFLDTDFYNNATIGQSIKEQLKMLWNYYSVSNASTIHADHNFIANFEVFVLTLLVSDDTFAQTNSNGNSYSFQDVLNQSEFEDKLEVFLKKRLDNIDASLYQSLESSVGVSLNNSKQLIEKINSDKISSIPGGFDFKMIKSHAVNTIKRYLAIARLYEFISNNADKTFIFERPNEIKIYVSQDSTQNFVETFIKLSQDVQESIDYIQFDYRIFNISPTKKISTGEQSLLNFFSVIYAFVRKGEHHLRKYNQYLLLLDEPETGYHAVWKKKFIKSITELLPILFKELKQNPKVQIIFTTHDALTLSDIPNDNIIYLKKLEDSSVKVYRLGEEGRPTRSFGANITDLLADSFFVEDGLLGDFSKSKIDEVLQWLNYRILKDEIESLKILIKDKISTAKVEEDTSSKRIEEELKIKNEELKNFENKTTDLSSHYCNSIINIVDEPLLHNTLQEMYDMVYSEQASLDMIKEYARRLGRDDIADKI